MPFGFDVIFDDDLYTELCMMEEMNNISSAALTGAFIHLVTEI